MARLALMVLVVFLAVPLTVQKSCTLVITWGNCLKECCGPDDNLYCLDSCVGRPCSTSYECDSSCCVNGSCTDACPTSPPRPEPPSPLPPRDTSDSDSSKSSSVAWWVYVVGTIVLLTLGGASLAWKYWCLPRFRRLAAPIPPANITVLAVVSDDAATVPPPYKP